MSDSPVRRAPPIDDEIARFLRPQPPAEIPRQPPPAPSAGLIARALLGDQVIKS